MRCRGRGRVGAAAGYAASHMTAATTAAHVSASAVLRKCHGRREHKYGRSQGSGERLPGYRTVWI